MSARSDDAIPTKPFGRHDVDLSVLGFGGHHLGDAPDVATAIRIVQEAVDSGINFFDNCWEYHRGKTEDWMGQGLKGRRDKVFLMTKVCTHGREARLATEMLEQSLRRLQTDHLDLWQIHGVGWDNDPDLFIRPNGAAEALRKAKEQGKIRFTGFTGHKDPAVHLKMIQTGFPFDAVQMPLNPFDAHFLSFAEMILPECARRGIAALGMKPLSGHGAEYRNGFLGGGRVEVVTIGNAGGNDGEEGKRCGLDRQGIRVARRDVRTAIGVGAADCPGGLHLLYPADSFDHGRRRDGQLGRGAEEVLTGADGEQVGAELVDLVEQAGLGRGGYPEDGDDGSHADGDAECG